jgi:hypothetical protein
MKDSSLLKRFNWAVLIVDEGHRLKDRSSKMFQVLIPFKTQFRVLLTGTCFKIGFLRVNKCNTFLRHFFLISINKTILPSADTVY